MLQVVTIVLMEGMGIDMKILFINGSPNKHGNTAALAERLLEGKDYQTLNLIDYKVYPLGKSYADDQFEDVIDAIVAADVIVMGSPVYWHSMTGQFRTLLDRIYESQKKRMLAGKTLFFIFQGAGPSATMLEAGNYTMGIFCRLLGLTYGGMITNLAEAGRLRNKL